MISGDGCLAVARNVGIYNARGIRRCRVDGDDWVGSATVGFVKRCAKTYRDQDVQVWDGYCYMKDAREKNRFPGGETRPKPR